MLFGPPIPQLRPPPLLLKCLSRRQSGPEKEAREHRLMPTLTGLTGGRGGRQKIAVCDGWFVLHCLHVPFCLQVFDACCKNVIGCLESCVAIDIDRVVLPGFRDVAIDIDRVVLPGFCDVAPQSGPESI